MKKVINTCTVNNITFKTKRNSPLTENNKKVIL